MSASRAFVIAKLDNAPQLNTLLIDENMKSVKLDARARVVNSIARPVVAKVC